MAQQERTEKATGRRRQRAKDQGQFAYSQELTAAITLAAEAPKLSAANTGFMLLASALVLIMTPGLAFFYGGMVRVKSTLNMLMMTFACWGGSPPVPSNSMS